MKTVYFCPYCNSAGWSGKPQELEFHIYKKHGKIVNSKDCIVSEVRVFDRYFEREKVEKELYLSV